MSDLDANKILLSGTVLNDPELRATRMFGPVCALRLQCNATRHPVQSTEEHAGCFQIVTLGALASEIAPRIHRRSRVMVVGWLASTRWESSAAREQEAVSVIAEQIELLASVSHGGWDDGESQRACVQGTDGCEHCRQRRVAIRHAHAQGQAARTLTGGDE